jgi:hypothetical protein
MARQRLDWLFCRSALARDAFCQATRFVQADLIAGKRAPTPTIEAFHRTFPAYIDHPPVAAVVQPARQL